MRARPLRSPLLVLALVLALALSACAAAPAPDPPPRAQRSANLSHITGTSRKIQMFLKNRNLQLLPDGTVNGTTDDTSEYTVLQRLTTGIGLLRIQGIATCLYLCMDSCGFLYAHKDFSDDCVFDEHMEENNYNTYSRTAGGKKTFVALDNRGRPRRLQIPEGRPLGNLSGYALTLTRRLDPAAGPKACARRHKDKHKRRKLPPPFHRNCARRLQRQKQKRQNKKAHEPERKKSRQPKGRRKHDNATTTTDHDWEESTSSTTTEEFFRSAAAREAVAGRA